MMNKLILFAAIATCAGIANSGDAEAQVGVEVVVAPPAAYIATVTPEYYEGRPVYFYNDHWYYRDRWGHWGYYRSEPMYLHGRRAYWHYPRAYDRGYVRPAYIRHDRVVERRPEPARYHYRR
ncbi:MAG TPA: hypothetical protein VLX92_35390 [Kofleriaceae bacterium]|nr:hypothetical protein [Kofleriaceae bacterium]